MATTTSLKISFSSDRFSTYAMAYKDTETPSEDEPSKGGEDSRDEKGDSKKDSDKSSDKKSDTNNQDTATGTVKTGDDNNALTWIIIFLMAAVAVIVSKLYENEK